MEGVPDGGQWRHVYWVGSVGHTDDCCRAYWVGCCRAYWFGLYCVSGGCVGHTGLGIGCSESVEHTGRAFRVGVYGVLGRGVGLTG